MPAIWLRAAVHIWLSYRLKVDSVQFIAYASVMPGRSDKNLHSSWNSWRNALLQKSLLYVKILWQQQ